MRKALGFIAAILSEITNGVAVIGLVYVVTQDVTVADVIAWLS